MDRRNLGNDIYSYIEASNRYTVKDCDTRHLIKNAIIPLDLKWKGILKRNTKMKKGDLQYSIVIDWSHW